MMTKNTMLLRMRWSTYKEMIRQYKPLQDETTAEYFERMVSSGVLKERKQ